MERVFSVRGYELDRTGVLPSVVLLRYMEHVRWEGLRAGGCLEGMFRGGRRIVVRQQHLLVEQWAGYGEELRVGLAIARVGRTSVQMVHEVRRPDGTPLARADLFAVQLDALGKPVPVGDDVRALALEGGAPQVEPVLTDEPPEDAWKHLFVVRPHEVDMLQHVNHSYYAQYFEDVRVFAAEAGVYGAASQAALGRPRAIAVDYVRSALPHDPLEVTTWATAEGALAFLLRRDDEAEPLCRGRIDMARSATIA